MVFLDSLLYNTAPAKLKYARLDEVVRAYKSFSPLVSTAGAPNLPFLLRSAAGVPLRIQRKYSINTTGKTKF